jgi:glyceraldehyde-3-phosphate dehydrogenase (NADP+)
VDLISFTGGRAPAERIAAAEGAKKIISELGRNNATIVCADADAEAAAKAIVAGAFGVAGQNCLSVQGVYVHTSLFEEVPPGGLRNGWKKPKRPAPPSTPAGPA